MGHADQHDARREEEDAAAVDADVQAFVAQQRAAGHVAESARAKEERMKAGGVRGGKSRYQREKEEAERKKAEEELAAKEAYKTFAAAMEGRGATAATAAGPGDKAKVKPMGFVSAGGERQGYGWFQGGVLITLISWQVRPLMLQRDNHKQRSLLPPLPRRRGRCERPRPPSLR